MNPITFSPPYHHLVFISEELMRLSGFVNEENRQRIMELKGKNDQFIAEMYFTNVAKMK